MTDKIINLVSDNEQDGWPGRIIQHARIIAKASDEKSELVGFFIVGFFSDGKFSAGCRYDPDRSPIPARLMPAARSLFAST